MTTSSAAIREHARTLFLATYLSIDALRAQGLSRRRVAQLVAGGRLLRVRRGRYVLSDTADDVAWAARLGGRLDCVSLLSALGVFVREQSGRLHIQIDKGASRLPRRTDAVTAHWRPSCAGRTRLTADLVEALVQAFHCQSVRDAIATLDSAWHHGLVDERRVDEVFARLPRRYRRLRGLIDRRAESGPETLMRLMLRALGCTVEVQVSIPGVGRVDLLVDGWLIIECDSRAHHEGWAAQKRDRRRDLAAAALGYTTVRPIAEDILSVPEEVLTQLKDALSHRPPGAGVRNSFESAHSRSA